MVEDRKIGKLGDSELENAKMCYEGRYEKEPLTISSPPAPQAR